MSTIRRIHVDRGVVTVDEVVADLARGGGREPWFEIVETVVETRDDLEWIDRPRRLFAHTGAIEGIADRIRKVLAVASAVTVSELVEAMLRDRRVGGVELPRELVLRVCEEMSEAELKGDVVKRCGAPPRDALSEPERVAAQIIVRRGPIVEEDELRAQLEAVGMGEQAARMVACSPIVTRVGRGRYALRGWGFDIEPPPVAGTSEEASRAEDPRVESTPHAPSSKAVDPGRVCEAGDAWRASLEGLEHGARRAALAEVLRQRPQTTLEELRAASGELAAWLGSASTEELARAALDAYAPPDTGQTSPRAPDPPRPRSPSRADRDPARARTPGAETAGRRVQNERYADAIVDVLARTPGGLGLEDIRPHVGGSQARLRRALRRLEAEGKIVRFGATRWTRYRLAHPEASDLPATISSAPLRRRREATSK